MKTVRAWWIPAEDSGPEREYLWPYINRELGIRLFYGGDQRAIQLVRINNGQKAIIFVDSSVKSFDFLKDFPNRSVIVFFVSDETYGLTPNLRIILKESVESIYRDYPIRNLRGLRGYARVVVNSFLVCGRNGLTYKGLIIAFVAGLVMLCRQLIIKVSAKLVKREIKHLPLGYTGWYSERLEREFGIANTLDFFTWSENQVKSGIPKQSLSFFAGQKGKFDRQMLLNQAERQGLVPSRQFENFGGPTESHLRVEAQEFYFEGLKESRFALCPPGNYSGETFRYLESLLLHSLPIRASKVLSDPFFSLVSSDRAISPNKVELERINEADRMAQIISQLENFRGKIGDVIADISSVGSS